MFIIKQKYGKIKFGGMMKKVLFLIPLFLITTSCKKSNSSKVLKYEMKLDNTYRVFLSEDSKAKSVTIPKKYNGVAVTEISGFRKNDFIETVKFYNTITNIEEGAFTYCTNLKSITVEKSEYYETKNGSLYKDNSLLVYASGKTDSEITVNENIKSRAFTIAPNLKKINIASSIVNSNSFVYLEHIEEIVIQESVINISNDFYSGMELNKLVIKSNKIANTLDVKNVKNLYVPEGETLTKNTSDLYTKVNIEKIDEVVYDVYNLK